MIVPQLVRLIHGRFKYRIKKVPFNKNLIVIFYDLENVLVAEREQGRTWLLAWKDVRITQFFMEK